MGFKNLNVFSSPLRIFINRISLSPKNGKLKSYKELFIKRDFTISSYKF